MKQVVILSASPKVQEASVSAYLSSLAETALRGETVDVRRIRVRDSLLGKTTGEDFGAMLQADAILIVFPLYFFCLPGMLTRYLQDYASYVREHGEFAGAPSVFAVVNCGFPEPEINEEAVRVIKRFAEVIGGTFRFGLMLGGGGMILGAQQAPFMKKTMAVINGAYARMKTAVLTGADEVPEHVTTAPAFPRKLYFLAGGFGWVADAKKNGLKKRDLYRKPYLTQSGR